MVAALSAGLLSSCASDNAEDELIEQGYEHLVTYDANGGDFNSITPDIQGIVYVRVKDNSLTIEPGYRPAGAGDLDIVTEPELSYHTLVGWELVEYNEDGEEIGTREWDFSSDRVTSDITLRAVWQINTLLYVNAIIDGEEVNFRTLTVDPGSAFISRFYNTTSDGTYSYRPDTIPTTMRNLSYNGTNYTPLRFYWLTESGEEVDLTVENAVFDEDATEMTVYAEVIEGSFTMVTQANASSLTLTSTSHWYLLEDIDLEMSYPEVDINRDDYESDEDYEAAYQAALIRAHMQARSWNALSSFEGVIYGNGHTISNIWVRSSVASNIEADTLSIFGEVSGIIEDVTFENVEYTVFAGYYSNAPAVAPDIEIAFLADEIAERGSVSAVVLENCTISVVNATANAGTLFRYEIAQNTYWFGDYSTEGISGEVTVVTKSDNVIGSI